MAYSTRTILILLASAVAVVFVGVAYITSGPTPFTTKTADAGSTHDLLVAYAAKDTDTDGLPDWEEALYGTDPNNAHSVNASVTDSQAVAQGLIAPKFSSATTTPVDVKNLPGTSASANSITDQFAQALFSQYLQQHGAGQPTPDEIATFVEQQVTQLKTKEASPEAFNQGQVKVVGTGPDALIAYAAGAETAFAKNTVATNKSEVEYFSDAIQKNDAQALAQTKKIGLAYSAIAKAYIAVPVPKEAAVPHLAVANALARLGIDISDMASMGTDPLRAYLGLADYQTDAQTLISALAALNTVYATEQVSVPDGTTGSAFYKTLLSAARASSATP